MREWLLAAEVGLLLSAAAQLHFVYYGRPPLLLPLFTFVVAMVLLSSAFELRTVLGIGLAFTGGGVSLLVACLSLVWRHIPTQPIPRHRRRRDSASS